MKTVYPDYFTDFKCIAEKCRHNCCIGWEIDIDQNTLDFYKRAEGAFGERLRENISLAGTPHFLLKKNDRCPFLNSQNLCDIYTELGQNCLCQICTDHPRFYNELEGRIEAGLGLCCEEAARLIITRKEPVKLMREPADSQDGILNLRNEILCILQDRSKSIPQRIESVYTLFGIKHTAFNILKWTDVFESLERLSEEWTDLLKALKENFEKADIKGFESFIKNRQGEYEQLLCYLVYRHLSKAEFAEDAAIYFAFAVLSYELIRTMGAVIFTKTDKFTTENQLELCRLFSSEIEYSDENLDIILSKLETEIFDCCN